MKKFIFKIFIFILPIAIVGCIMEILIRNIPNDYTLKKEYLDENANKIKTLAFGHSQILNGFNPEDMSMNSYNVAFSGQSIKYDYKILEKYSEKLVSLKYVVIPISYLSLSHQLENSILSNYVKNYSIYLDIDTDSKSLFKNKYEIFSYKFKTNVNRLRSYYLNEEDAVAFGEFGWKEISRTRDLIETGKHDAKKSMEFMQFDAKNQYRKENVKYLKSIFEICNKRKIHVILITPPTYYSYRNNIDQSHFKTVHRVINEFIENYDNATYLDLFDHIGFKAKDYRDANHLNELGARKMTKIIDKHINELKK